MINRVNINNFLSSSRFEGERLIVVYPTDTVYGIGGDPFDIISVSRLIHIKKRKVKPFPILISRREYAYKLAHVGVVSRHLIDKFWPGKLTIVLESKLSLPAIQGSEHVGIRLPGSDKVIRLIEVLGGFLIGTSANISGMPPALTCEEAEKYFGGEVDLYICADDIITGKPSTAVFIDDDKRELSIIREGAISSKELISVCEKIGCKVCQ